MDIVRKHRLAKPFRLAALAALALAFAQPVLAQSEFAEAPQGKVSASSSITFRIIVRESVKLDAQAMVADAGRSDLRSPPPQRKIDVLDGMQRITLARP